MPPKSPVDGVESPATEAKVETRRSRFRRAWMRGWGFPGGAPHSHTRGDDSLLELNQDWRRNISFREAGLTPLLDEERDHVRGSAEAAVTLVEYGEYESQSCRAAARDVRAVCERYGASLRFVFRHFPLGDAHPLALHAAQAAEAAGAQGRFWEMHDAMYDGDLHLEPKMLRGLADRLGLDVDRFASEMGEESHLPHVLDDFGSGVRSGVNGTPTFFVDGDRFEWDHERGTLDRAVASAGARPAD
jgi:2-hydroxychromene-2-carboxylate isomerase